MAETLNQTPVIYQINANDLKEIVGGIVREERERTAQEERERKEHGTVGRKETAKMLGVSVSTLWKWAQCGYLIPIKVGTKVLYRYRDIEAMLIKQEEGGIS